MEILSLAYDGFMSILVKCILKTLLKIYDGFCVMMDFPYELFVKRSPDYDNEKIIYICIAAVLHHIKLMFMNCRPLKQ